jgi:hypothetical protein
MLGKNIIRKSVTLMTIAAVWCVYSMAVFALPVDTAGEITVTGQVTVNGQPAVSGSTVLTGAVVSTAKGSSAVVSLGKIGRVEVLESTSVTLNFGTGHVIAMLDLGKVRISSSSGAAATVTTKNATFVGDAAQANTFLVEAECSHAHLDTATGVVSMREGASSKQIAAGGTATAGNLEQTGCKPCLRPDSTPPPAIAGAPWLILLGAIGGGVAIWLGTQKGRTTTSGGAVIVSPVR